MTPLVLARDVTRSHGRVPALRGVSVTVGEREVVALTGARGSGKSTLLHCLAGILRPDAGEVTYQRQRLDTLSESARARVRLADVGVILQLPFLVVGMPAVENVAMPLLLAGTRRPAALTAARGWLDRMGVGAVAETVPAALSEVEFQRVLLARAFVNRPRLVLADAPAEALDPDVRDGILGDLVGAARELGTAVLLVSRDAAVARYADRHLVLRDGALVAP